MPSPTYRESDRVEGTTRSSNNSRDGLQPDACRWRESRGRARPDCGAPVGAWSSRLRLRHMVTSFLANGLRYHEKAIAPGAQTERRGEAGPVSVLFRGWDSPAAFVNQSTPSNHRSGERQRIAKDAEAILGLGEQRIRARCQVDREGE